LGQFYLITKAPLSRIMQNLSLRYTTWAWAVAELSDGTISEVGQLFGRDITTLSACIKRMTDKAQHDSEIAGRME